MKILVIGALTGLTVLGGCAEVSFKRGGGVEQLRADRQVCAATDDAATCMKNKGWGTFDMASRDAAVAEEAAPEPMETPEATPAVPVVAASPGIPSPDSTSAAPALTPAEKKADPRGLASGKAKPKALPKDPYALVTVSSWWKPGGSNPQDAISTCVSSLGESHMPDYAAHKATSALVACMRKSGWFGV